MATDIGFSGMHNSQAIREPYRYYNNQGQLGMASTVMLGQPPQVNGTRLTLSSYLVNISLGDSRTVRLRKVDVGGVDDDTKTFFSKILQPGESFVLPVVVLKGLQELRGLCIEAPDEVNFFINYKEEI